MYNNGVVPSRYSILVRRGFIEEMKRLGQSRLLLLLSFLSPTIKAISLSAVTPRIIIVGGSSGMGKGLAKAVVGQGGSVLLASRNAHDCSHGDAGSRGDDGDGEGVDERGNSGGRGGYEAAAGRRIATWWPPGRR